jgi:hypothetical protein
LLRDEAESGINALTILQHGFPVDHYMGMPIYENTLVKPWPGNIEYEFRDSSYSDRGIAIYHGWLPLYAMAASFRFDGIRADAPESRPRVRYDQQEMRERARAARLPSVAFAAVFLAAIYAAGRVMSGPVAGASALAIAAFLPPCVEYGRQARYYSAATAFGVLAFVALWQVARRGTWRSYGFWTLALILLFFSYAVAFAAAVATWALVAPWSLRQRSAVRKSLASTVAVCAAVLPWLALTGAIHHHTAIPAARSLLVFPRDYTAYLAEHSVLVVASIFVVVCLVVLAIGRSRLSGRLALGVHRLLPPMAFASLWILIGFATFVLVVPASSLFMGRVKLATLGPAIVLVGILVDLGTEAIVPKAAAWAPLVVLAGVLAASCGKLQTMVTPLRWEEPGFGFVEAFRNLDVEAGTRIYALPFENLALTFAAGLPVQSIAPVRKSFLDGYAGRILIIDPIANQKNDTQASIGAQAHDGLWQNPAIFRGFESFTLDTFWVNFFYRFVNPSSRSGAGANFAQRETEARILRMPGGWVVYDCPAKPERQLAGREDR